MRGSRCENISVYLEMLEMHILATGMEDGKKVPSVLSAVGAKTYALLKSLLAPDLPKSKSYEDLRKLLKAHYEPKSLVIAELFHFYRRSQALCESVADFAADLRRLSIHCEFKADRFDEAFRDRFVCCLCNEAMQKRSLAEDKHTMAHALKVEVSKEAADKNAKELKGSVAATALMNIAKSKSKQTCYRCGHSGHGSKECCFRDGKCHKCGKLEHINSACHSSNKKFSNLKKSRNSPDCQTRWVDTAQPQVNDNPKHKSEMSLLTVSNTATTHPLKGIISINGKPITMELDTGTVVSVISDVMLHSCFSEA